MASEQSSREVLKRPLVAALTPKMSDAAIRAAFRIYMTVCRLSVRSLTYCRCGAKGYEAYHWAMSRIRPEYLDAETSDRWVAADVLVREEPDEEDDDEEGDGEERGGKEKTTGATQSDQRVSLVGRLSFPPRGHRPNKARQAQTLEPRRKRSPAVIRPNEPFQGG